MIQIGQIKFLSFPLLLAPMEDVSDPPFRLMCKEQGADLMFSEFISSEGLIRDAIKSKKKLEIFEKERPVGIQIFGGDEEALRLSTQIVDATHPDLLDINYGCPVKKVVIKGAGAGVLKDCPLMVRLTKTVVNNTQLPVTVKTRLGWDEQTINIEQIAEQLQDVGIKALTIHCRTRSQMYKGEANWEWINKVKNNPRIHIPIFGNGDIDSPQKALEYKNKYAVDGIMIGRAAIGNPWIFKKIKHYFNTKEILPEPTLTERIEVCRRHLILSMGWKGTVTGILEMRRHYANYFRGYNNIKEFRNQLVQANNLEQIDTILYNIKKHYANADFQAIS